MHLELDDACVGTLDSPPSSRLALALMHILIPLALDVDQLVWVLGLHLAHGDFRVFEVALHLQGGIPGQLYY